MPENEGEVVILLPLLAELEKSALSGVGVEQVNDKTVYLALFVNAERNGWRATRGVGDDALMGSGMGESRSFGVGDGAGVGAVLHAVLHVRDWFWRDEPRHRGSG